MGALPVFPNSTLDIVGDGPLRKQLEASFSHPNITFRGSLDHSEVLAILARSHIFLYPTNYPEGLPTNVLEACMAGCAVVTRDFSAASEIFGGASAFVGHSDEELSIGLTQYITHPKIARSHGRSLAAAIERNFSWKMTAEVLLDLHSGDLPSTKRAR